MIKCKFENVEELKTFLKYSDYDEVRFCIDPDYIDAIIGLSDEGKIVYDYFLMVAHLAKIYEADGTSEDPEMDAIEWIDYNCDMPYWEIVTTNDDGYIENFISEQFDDYMKYIIGMNMYGILLIDSEKVTEQNIDDIEEILKKDEVEYKIV